MAEFTQPTGTTRKRLVLAACILGSTVVFVDSTVVNVALPALQRDLGGGLALQQWVVDAYLLTLGALLLLGGSLGDLYGGRTVFAAGVLAFGLASVLTPAAPATITAVFSGEERGQAIGAWTAWTGIAFVIGPLVGGWLVSVASWRSIFLVNVPLVAATL